MSIYKCWIYKNTKYVELILSAKLHVWTFWITEIFSVWPCTQFCFWFSSSLYVMEFCPKIWKHMFLISNSKWKCFKEIKKEMKIKKNSRELETRYKKEKEEKRERIGKQKSKERRDGNKKKLKKMKKEGRWKEWEREKKKEKRRRRRERNKWRNKERNKWREEE